MNKPTFLRNLKIRKVDLVDQGANQHAHIRLAKRNDETSETTDATGEEKAFFARIGAGVAKLFRAEAEKVDKGGAVTFEEASEARDMHGAIYRISDAMCESVQAIMSDGDLSDAQRAEMLNTTAEQVADAIKEIAGKLRSAVEKIDEALEEPPLQEPAEPASTGQDTPISTTENDHEREGEIAMNFDTVKMTPEDKAAFDELAKRYAVEEPAPTTDPAPTTEAAPSQPETDDVYKGLHPAVKAELESLRKFREESEMRRYSEIAKKYTLLGKKPEELAVVLKSLNDAGGTAYADMIGLLDSNLALVEKSGAFGELGKRGADASDDPWGKIEAAAHANMKLNANMRWAEAVEKACNEHPDLVEEYEKSRK